MRTTYSTPRPLLGSEHFAGVDLRQEDGALRFDTVISAKERTVLLHGHSRTGEFSQRIQALPTRVSTRCILNPYSPTPGQLWADFGVPDVAPTHDMLPADSTLAWRVGLEGFDEVGLLDEHALVLVASNGLETTGYVYLRACIHRQEGSPEMMLTMHVQDLRIRPADKGMGYTLDLTIACGHLWRELCLAVCRAAPVGCHVVPYVVAEPACPHGQHIAEHLAFEVTSMALDLQNYDLAERGMDVVLDQALVASRPRST